MDIKRFCNKTIDILRKLPYWFDAKHKDNTTSTTARFLDSFGEIIQDFSECIEFAYKMCKLDTFENEEYIVYKTHSGFPKVVMVNGDLVEVYEEEFYFVKQVPKQQLAYYYDERREMLYFSGLKPGDLVNVNNNLIEDGWVEHFIWGANILDEYGLFFDLPRNPKESNKDYKTRLLEYSKNLANSSSYGLSSYIGHITNLYKIIEWVDGGVDIEISLSVTINSNIYVDDKPYIHINKVSDTKIILYGKKEFRGVSRKIKYFYGYDIYNLRDIDKNNIYNNFYNSNNTPTKDLINLFNDVSKKCPIMWGICRWGTKFWINDNYENYMFLEPTFDPDISKLKIK